MAYSEKQHVADQIEEKYITELELSKKCKVPDNIKCDCKGLSHIITFLRFYEPMKKEALCIKASWV
jgi:hypothetical protein